VIIIAFASQKGGVGKTTLALNLAHALARRSWTTLLVDTDPQGGIGASLGGRAHQATGLAALLEGSVSLEEVLVPTRLAELTLLPFGELAPRLHDRFAASLADGTRLQSLLSSCAERFDLVLVDTASGLTGATIGTLRAATHVVAPLQAEPLALRSLPALIEIIGELRAEGLPIELAGLVPTMVMSRNEVSMATTQEVFRLFPADAILESFVPRDPVFLDASAEGVPVGLLSRRPPRVASVFDQIAAELEPRLGLVSLEERHDPIPLVD